MPAAKYAQYGQKSVCFPPVHPTSTILLSIYQIPTGLLWNKADGATVLHILTY